MSRWLSRGRFFLRRGFWLRSGWRGSGCGRSRRLLELRAKRFLKLFYALLLAMPTAAELFISDPHFWR